MLGKQSTQNKVWTDSSEQKTSWN